MKTIDDLLQGTKYANAAIEGLEPMAESLFVQGPFREIVRDAAKNAVLAHLIGPLVEALDEANRMSQDAAYTKYQVASHTAKALIKAREVIKIVEADQINRRYPDSMIVA